LHAIIYLISLLYYHFSNIFTNEKYKSYQLKLALYSFHRNLQFTFEIHQFFDNCYYKEKIKGVDYKIFKGYLSYQPTHCYRCGCVFDNLFEKHGFIVSNIKIPNISGFKALLRLHKQRYFCKHCNKAFTLKSNIVDSNCFISNSTKWHIAYDLMKKRSEKDIAMDNNVSPNTVERIMDSYYNTIKIYKNFLPKVLSFDEFKSVKSAEGAMSFHLCNGETGQTIDIVENRRLSNLIDYFSYFSRRARYNVHFIVIDMYSPYVSLISKMFPNAKIIIDKFHLVQLISRSFNKTRINIMKHDKKNYNKMKRYWKLLLKDRNELDFEHWNRFTCFSNMMTESDVVNFIIQQNDELRHSYLLYQDLLQCFKKKDKHNLVLILSKQHNNVSLFMKTSLKTLKDFQDNIFNTFDYNYHNGFIEGNNNFIKVIKRIAFGFRSFRRFKARIMICKGLVSLNKKANVY
jgi:transposase